MLATKEQARRIMAWAPATLLSHLHYQGRPRLDKHDAS
jgi:hypothetical protein